MEITNFIGPLVSGIPVAAWIDILTFLAAIFVVMRLNGGKLMYSVWLVGATGLIGFLGVLTGGPQAIWILNIIKSAVLLFSVVWYLFVFKT